MTTGQYYQREYVAQGIVIGQLHGLVATQLTIKEAKKVWEEERSYVTERERRVMASYKEYEGFHCNLEHASQFVYWAGVKFEHQTEVQTMQWELVESSPEVDRGLDDVVWNLPRTHQRFVGSSSISVGSSSIGCRELARSSQEEC
ncbi:hypothetical protein BHE74_00051439 [Ensete ventricosum]|nr:hypothetical protein BHE74_00051439 [Ensete ventricosum]RZR85926.1 hypothetical protein BHM03_00012998 [Ensete ventricosum]